MTDRVTVLRPAIQAALDKGGIDAICEIIAAQEVTISKLEARITELEKRLNKNSSNSSKPPSSDGFKRTKSLRPKNTGRKPGGQPGHPGQTLEQAGNPDIIIPISLETCPECSSDLGSEPVLDLEKRQVLDLPPIKIQVTEYQAERKICPQCGKPFTATFPANVCGPIQYGPAMQATMSYLNVRQLIPCARTAEVCQDLFGHRPSAGSVVQAVVQCANHLAPAVDEIREIVAQAPVLHADETGIRCIGKGHWLHVVSTGAHTLYSYSPHRGAEGLAAGQVLPDYNGILVHDFWSSYDMLDIDHGRCNAHLMRELKAFVEDGHAWAGNIITALIDMKEAADQARANGETEIPDDRLAQLQKPYDDWVAIGLEAHPERPKQSGKRGRTAQSKETNLLRRLRDKREEVLRFTTDLQVPFDNNQAERDLRMVKVQQKVSGCFRSDEGAKRFCTISSYISTIRKLGLNLMESIKSAFNGDPVKFTS